MFDFLYFFIHLLNSTQSVIIVIGVALLIKGYLLGFLLHKGLRSISIPSPWFLLLGVIIGSMAGDACWILKIIRPILFPKANYGALVFFIRIAWAFLIIQFQSLALFIESLTQRKLKLGLLQKQFLFFSSCFFFYFLYISIFENSLTNEYLRTIAFANPLQSRYFEIKMMQYSIIYLFSLLVLPCVLLAFFKIRVTQLPKILKKQLKTVLQFLIFPYLVAQLILAIHFNFTQLHLFSYAIMNISTLLITYAIFYSIKKVMGLRFLNFNKQVTSHFNPNFINSFKQVLEQLSHAATNKELEQITKQFFKNSFTITQKKTHLFIRAYDQQSTYRPNNYHHIEGFVEELMQSHPDCSLYEFILQEKILIYDELNFSNFYQNNPDRRLLLEFLNQINADVFVPILGKDRIIAYIVIERDSRQHHLYGHFERDKMAMYATYLANIVHLMQNRSLETLIHQEKELKEELYNKHQELNQYRESIRSFLKRTEKRLIGIIFYKNRRFIFGNQAAKQLVTINPNNQEGHPLAKALKHIARQTEKYKTPQKIFTRDNNNNELILSSVSNLEQNNVIVMAYYPDIVDIVKKQIDHLKDPSQWDYLLYLETTESGQLINQLIPGNGELLLNFKIDLLKTALSKKVTLLTLAEEDLLPTIEILHHISLRKILHTIKLDRPTNNLSVGIQLFGINPLFGLQQEKPLLEKLDGIGTLFIQNIEHLDLATQQHLAQFIHYGYFTILKSDQRVCTSVRIICSTNQDLALLVQEGQFSLELFNELKQAPLVMPAIDTLPDEDLHELAKGFSQQFFKTQEFNNVLTLTDKDKLKLTRMRPMSLQELKEKIGKIVTEKSKHNLIYQETQFDPAFEISDPELIEAVRLGRHALRDAKIMTLLWNKFKNQNKIAMFLGVNRSSVNRRCKEYNLQ